MPETTKPNVDLTLLQALADLERLEVQWLNAIVAGDP